MKKRKKKKALARHSKAVFRRKVDGLQSTLKSIRHEAERLERKAQAARKQVRKVWEGR